ncbi:unnamed protein product [Lepeophtheirus salmonis]|uniref:(salmon louse) hypothetical protein n=1 Tax=Lepeophtheirus salmonis TaxID=72036 RepID=A0A7R8CV69_LEPSM|nr:unnamed protein product [Lepeophtheirus salmonis]CAF2907392.1 unnamed protein product [Lepeophtheirus salmonis]
MSMGGAIPEENKKERIIPIRILKSPHVIHEEDEDEENEENEVRGEARGEQKQEPQQSKRHSLSVELDDGTITETQGTSIPLSSTEMDKEEFQTSTTSSTSRTEHIRIEEIGIDTMKREIRGASPNSEKVQKGNGSSIIRLVPISLPDGKLIQADSEETLTPPHLSTLQLPTKNFLLLPPAHHQEQLLALLRPPRKKKQSSSLPLHLIFYILRISVGLLTGRVFLQPRHHCQGMERKKESKSSSSTSTKTFEDILVTEETLARNGYKSDKKPEAGRPTVRFSVDSDDTIKRKKEETENEIHKIDQDISKIWNDLKELDSEPRPGSSVSSWPKTTNPPPRYPKQQPPIPHKVSVLESPKYTPIRESSLTRPGVIKSSSPGSTLKSLKTNDLNNPFGPIDEKLISSNNKHKH